MFRKSLGEGNGTPLQYSCLENPMDGGAWWAAVHGVAEESDMTEWLHFHFSLSCIGEGNGNPFHYSCLENPRDGGVWWAAIYGVAQSWTRLKRLRSSSSSSSYARWLASIAIYLCFVNIKELQSWIWNSALTLFSLNTYQSIWFSPWLGMPQFQQTHLQSFVPLLTLQPSERVRVETFSYSDITF